MDGSQLRIDFQGEFEMILMDITVGFDGAGI